jgi:selenocysteine-specific elongation factor
MSCIGTAGHIDHGKSTLVKALTGIDPDRLAEEKERGMTIDLGFAWLTLPNGREVSIVDVPGHEGFIKNMLAGVGSIDAALLVIAADESVMPQTREHLAILDLLHVRRAVVALTKADLVDEEWLELVREEVTDLLAPTTLAGAPIIPVSAVTQQGIPELLAELERMLDEAEERQDTARPRLPVDRVFTMTGFGTIVTGTLIDGGLRVGQEVEILPTGVKTRIRGMQTHRHSVETALPGNRTAINLAGIPRSDIARGNIVALPGQLRSTMLIDIHLQLLASAPFPLAHNTLVDFFSSTQEIPARVRLLDTHELQPGKSGWVQLRLSRPAVLARRDRFILRIPSPSTTIGGGEVVDVHPRFHKRFQQQVLKQLATLEYGAPDELVLAALDRRAMKPDTAKTKGLVGYELAEVSKQANLAQDVTQQMLETLLQERRVRQIGIYWFALPVWEALVDETTRMLRAQHEHYPLRGGLSKEEWRTRLHLSPKMASEVFAVLTADRIVEEVAANGFMRLPGFVPTFTPTQKQQVERLLKMFHENPFTPPGRAEAEVMVGPDVLAALIDQGQLVKLGESVLFLRETYEQAVEAIINYLRTHGTITVAETRDLLGATRKYMLPLLEHLDALKITRRSGDERFLGINGPPLPGNPPVPF